MLRGKNQKNQVSEDLVPRPKDLSKKDPVPEVPTEVLIEKMVAKQTAELEDSPVGYVDAPTDDDAKNLQGINDQIRDFDAKVILARNKGQKWMEVPKHLLSVLCGGEYPEVGYICWKNVKVCEIGCAEKLAQKDGETAFSRAFPNSDMKVL